MRCSLPSRRRSRRPGTARMGALSLAVAAGLTACSAGIDTPDGSSSADVLGAPPALSELAPGDPVTPVQLEVLSLEDGAPTIDFGDLGGPAVVNFWATWCAFCVDEMPDFEAVHQRLGDQVRFIGVDREDSVERALTFVEEVGVTYELVEDPDGAFFRASKGRGMPTTLFVDADGIIRYRHAGPMSAETLEDLLSEHLDVEAA